MFPLITVSFSIFIFGITGWTLTTYLVKEDSQQVITDELKKLYEICKDLVASLRSLVGILAKYSRPFDSNKSTSSDADPINVETLKAVQQVAPDVKASVEDDDELASFSPELIEAITEEEEKVA